MKRFLASTLFVILSSLFLVGMASAHSNIVSAVPADGAEGAAPSAIEVTFNEKVNLVFSSLTLVGPDGAEIALGQLTPISDGNGMVAPVITELSSGTYTVNWTLLSPDGHKLEGSYDFTVAP